MIYLVLLHLPEQHIHAKAAKISHLAISCKPHSTAVSMRQPQAAPDCCAVCSQSDTILPSGAGWSCQVVCAYPDHMDTGLRACVQLPML
jgi:hypothetical protein